MTADELDDRIDQWHDGAPGSESVTLWEWLGWTRDEFAEWVLTCEQPKPKEEP